MKKNQGSDARRTKGRGPKMAFWRCLGCGCFTLRKYRALHFCRPGVTWSPTEYGKSKPKGWKKGRS